LNRVVNKPQVEKDESKKNDEVKSLKQWYGFLLRNQSILVDLLYGQFKSILYCPDEKCQNVSTTFDPFLSISLPLTNTEEYYEVNCYFIFYDIKISPIQLTLPYRYECSIMTFRNKISKILDIHPFSFFIIKLGADANFDQIISSTGLLRSNNHENVNQKYLFLFQINPALFYNETENKFYSRDKEKFKIKDFSKTFEYLESNVERNIRLFKEDFEEDESGASEETTQSYYSKIPGNSSKYEKSQEKALLKINIDDNHGFSNEYLKIVIFLFTYSTKDNRIPDVRVRERIIFPRIMYFKKNLTTETIHRTIFEYFEKIFNTRGEKVSELWKNLFGKKIDTNYANDNYEFHSKKRYPYRLRVRNIYRRMNKPCVLCQQVECYGCLLPCSNKIKLKDILKAFPLNSENQEIDNTYFYLSETQRELHDNHNVDFSLELTWLPEYKEEVYKLNNKLDHDFKLQKSEKITSISIYDCFKKFVKFEKLEDMNEWFCTQCKTHQKATKKMEIYKLPHILIIHLKRFKDFQKVETFVDYPIIDLDLKHVVISNYEKLSMEYDLFGVANHVGNTSLGHYYSYAKNPFTGLWYKYDDSLVTMISQNDIVTENAYVLFYRRKNLENIIDLQEIYRNKFINYSEMIENVEATIKALNELNNFEII